MSLSLHRQLVYAIAWLLVVRRALECGSRSRHLRRRSVLVPGRHPVTRRAGAYHSYLAPRYDRPHRGQSLLIHQCYHRADAHWRMAHQWTAIQG